MDQFAELQIQSAYISHDFMSMHALAVYSGLCAWPANGEGGCPNAGVSGYPHFLRARREFEALAGGQPSWEAREAPPENRSALTVGSCEPVHSYEPAHPLADDDGYVAYPARGSSSFDAAARAPLAPIGTYEKAAEVSRTKLRLILDTLN